MTTRDSTWPEGTPCWVDLAVPDFELAQTFYGTLFGWHIERGPEELHGYASCTKDGRVVAGLMPALDPGQPSVWTTYLATDDLDATLAKAREAGGTTLTEAIDVGDTGRMALATDPGGALVGFWQGKSHTGYELANEPGSVTWNENMSRAWEQNKQFYRAVSGFQYDDLPGDFAYATFKAGGNLAGGIGAIGEDWPTEVPAHWATYFKVADADEAAAEVERLGGGVTQPPWDTEFGRMAAVTDNQGVAFMVMADPR